MKKYLLSFFLIITLLFSGFSTDVSAQEQGLNLQLVPQRLLQSLPSAMLSGTGNGYELPAQIDIGSSVLIPRSQGSLGSCASWATAAEQTRVERLRNNWPVGRNISYFSPLYFYNQVNGGFDNGSSIYSNLNILVNRGSALLVTFPYTNDYRIQPSVSAHREAARYKISEFKTIPVDVDAIRVALVQGFGVIVSFHVYDNFDSYSGGIYRPRGASGVARGDQRFSYHAMLIIGYDNTNSSFKLLNSWGPSWGDNGFLHISYNDVRTLIRDCYILIPKSSLPSEVVPPSGVQAGKGSNRDKVVISWERNGANEYEVFRLAENELYVSLGKTSGHFFEDTTVVPNERYFYFVAAHGRNYMSVLSYAAEGWANSRAEEVPGIPTEFTASLQGRTIITQWKKVDNASLYQVYRFSDSAGEYVLAGETTDNVFRMSLPSRINSPVMTFFVLARNSYGQGLPSEPAAITIENWQKPDVDEPDNRFEVYRGGFYIFPIQRFKNIERQAMEYFKNQRNQALNHFRGQRNDFMNRMQNSNRSFLERGF